jgi:AraC-like DNA-binding protein
MIESLDGIRETVNFKSNTHIRLYTNVEIEYYPNHWHAPLELVMPLENSYHVTCSSIQYELRKGDILLIVPGAIHSMGSTQLGRRLIFQADFTLLHGIKELEKTMTIVSPALYITPENFPVIHESVRQLVLEIADEYSSVISLSEAAIYAKLIQLLVLVGRNYQIKTGLNTEIGHKHRGYMERFIFICDYIDRHYNENLTLDDVADLSGFSKYYFSRLFKQFANVSFYKYLNRKRIENAVILMMDQQLTITDVALHCGFSSLSAFIRMFKAIKECTPSEFKSLYTDRWDLKV